VLEAPPSIAGGVDESHQIGVQIVHYKAIKSMRSAKNKSYTRLATRPASSAGQQGQCQ